MAAHDTASQEAQMFLADIGANHRRQSSKPRPVAGSDGHGRRAAVRAGRLVGDWAAHWEGVRGDRLHLRHPVPIPSKSRAMTPPPTAVPTCCCSTPPPSPSASCDARHEERLDDRAGEEAVQEKCPPRCGRAFVLGRLQLLRRQLQNQGVLGIKRRFDAIETPPSGPNRPPVLYNEAFEPVLTEQERHLAADSKAPVSLRFCWSVHKCDSFTTAKRLRER